MNNNKNNKTNSLENFDWITARSSEYMKMVKEALAIKEAVNKEVKSVPIADLTFENSLKRLEFTEQLVSAIWGKIEFLMNVKPNEVDRKAAKVATDFLRDKYIEMDYDEEIFNILVALENKKPKLDQVEKKLFTETMLAYKRMGFGLPKAKRNLVKRKVMQLANESSDFRKNLNEYQDFILVTKEELTGASPRYISGLKKVGSKYKVSLDYPDYIPFMQNVSNEKVRKVLFEKYLQQGGQKNMKVLAKMVKIREELAKLLGYKNHATFVLETRMAKNPETAFKFLNGLITPVQKKVSSDIAELTKFKGSKIHSHDILYLINQTKNSKFKIDDELVREYFPVDVVTKGLFEIYQTLFNVKFKELKNVPTWHKSVQCFGVFDNKTKKQLAYFFLDLFPRAGKYGHAAVFPIVPGMALPNGEYQKPVVGMLCNFADRLSHNEVDTFFHEFGHVVHGVLTTARFGTQSGTSVQRDFVEAPSQMLENWVWDEKMLQKLSGHYKNPKKKLPKELLNSILSAKQHMIGYTTMRQLVLASFDMQLHTRKNVKNIAKLYGDLVKKHIGVVLPKEQIFPAGFGHMDGYDAGYYGYMWSLVFAADMFTRFKQEGLLNPKTGGDYRAKILAPGSSKESIKLITDFLGRKPNNKAFLKELGL